MNFYKLMDEKIGPVMSDFAQNRYIQAIRDGVVLNLVPSMIGSFFLLIAALPIPGYRELLQTTGIFDALLLPIGATLDLMGMTACIAIAYRLAESFKKDIPKLDPLGAGVISLLAFFLLTPYRMSHELVEGGINGVMPIMYLGSRGLFTAILISLSATRLYIAVIKKEWIINMPEGVPPAVAKSFMALIPGAITLIAVWVIRLFIDASPFDNIHTILADFVQKPLTGIGGTLFGAIMFMLLVHIFWFFGIHGHLVVGPVLDPIFTVLQDQNRIAFQNGEAIPHIFTRFWFDLYVTMGGSGATLAAIFGLLIFSRSQHLKQVSRLSITPGLFNINEPFLFGLPVVFNPIIFVPWILVPVLNIIVAYTATIIGFLPRHNGVLAPWTTPVIISGFLVAGCRGVVMQLINLCLSALVWLIFLRKIDNIEAEKELKSLQNIKE